LKVVSDQDDFAESVASLARDHDDFAPRLRRLPRAAKSTRAGVVVHAHYVSFQGARPTIDEFVEILGTKLVGFCLPRREVGRAKARWADLPPSKVVEDAVRLHNRAVDLFIKANRATNRNGEFGELIAYLLVESVLRAPQLVAKMSLKTSGQMPVHGSDGIHFRLDPPDGRLRLFWGESKCYQSVSSALAEAAKSIAENLAADKMRHELFLVDQHADFSDLPHGLADAVLEFLDPYSEKSNLRLDTSVMLIAFDFAGFASLSGIEPEAVETAFEHKLEEELPNLAARLDQELAKRVMQPHDIHAFFLPVPSIAELRAAFQARIGWTN
jgi:hypothetical protein